MPVNNLATDVWRIGEGQPSMWNNTEVWQGND